MQKLFVRSKKNVLIEVHIQVRLPRTFRRFCGLFAQLLQKLSVRSTNSKERMLKVRGQLQHNGSADVGVPVGPSSGRLAFKRLNTFVEVQSSCWGECSILCWHKRSDTLRLASCTDSC
jgi:hypothetical protein